MGCIGLFLALAQPVRAQLPTADGAGGVGWLAGQDEPFRDRFTRLLTSSASRDYGAGLALANDTGRIAVPMLWQMVLAEKSNVVRRNSALAAAMLAADTSLDDTLYEWLGQQKAIRDERTMVALAIALAPPRTRKIADFWSRSLGPTRSPEEILAIAVRLAAARVPGSAKDAPPLSSDAIGLVAATAFADLPVGAGVAGRLWDLRERGRHDDLFWRAALLAGARLVGDGGAVNAELRQHAREVAALAGEQFAPAREAAALFRAIAGDLTDGGARPEPWLLRPMASTPAAAKQLKRWLGPSPAPRDEEPQRLAVSYVLSRDPAEVMADRAAWGRDDRINRHVAVALALRLLDDQNASVADVQVAGLPEWGLVRWAGGLPMSPERCADATLTTMLELAADGRLPRPAAAAALEATLWRWGSHPGLNLYAAEQLLVRDLLLVGSGPGTKYVPHIPPEQRHSPKGIGQNSRFFDIAVEYYDFVSQQRSRLPQTYRLR